MGPNTWPARVSNGLGGGVFCVLSLRVRSALGADVQFPAFAGDDDFACRAMWLVLVLLPGFVVAGAWLGAKAAPKGWPVLSIGYAGACTASAAFFGALYALRHLLWSLSSRHAANAAAVGAMLLWLGAAVAGAALAGRAASAIMRARAAGKQP